MRLQAMSDATEPTTASSPKQRQPTASPERRPARAPMRLQRRLLSATAVLAISALS